MINLTTSAQIIVAASVYYVWIFRYFNVIKEFKQFGLSDLTRSFIVYYVWIFRYFNVIKEFKQFGLSDLTRSFIGATKISLATLLIVGIWHPEFVTIPAILMGLLMVSAQFFHFKIKNPFIKHLPSLVLLILCSFITIASLGLIKL